jgi:uncharacterized membrane protein YdjX (TVP38/TMEM64 family)
MMTEDVRSSKRRGFATWARRVGIALLVAAIAYVVIAIWDHEAIVRWMSEASPVPFFVAMAVLPAFGLPISPFMIVAGATFGVWGGLIGGIAAIAANLCIAYAIAHSALRPRITSLFERLGYKIPNFTAGGRAAWRFAATIKLTPALPTFAKMYVLAITAVPFPIYFGVSLVISSVFAVAWALLGDALLTHDINHAVVAAILIAVLAVVAVKWWRGRSAVCGDDASAAAPS